MKKPAKEKTEGERGGAKDRNGAANLSRELFGERANVGVGVGKVGEHRGDGALCAGGWSGVGVVESGGDLAGSFGDGAGVELNLLGNRSDFGLDKGLADGLCDFGGDRVGVEARLDFGRDVEEAVFELGVGLENAAVERLDSAQRFV